MGTSIHLASSLLEDHNIFILYLHYGPLLSFPRKPPRKLVSPVCGFGLESRIRRRHLSQPAPRNNWREIRYYGICGYQTGKWASEHSCYVLTLKTLSCRCFVSSICSRMCLSGCFATKILPGTSFQVGFHAHRSTVTLRQILSNL